MDTTIKQETIGKYYIAIERKTRWDSDYYEVTSSHLCGDYYRTDKKATYPLGALDKAKATYNRYKRTVSK